MNDEEENNIKYGNWKPTFENVGHLLLKIVKLEGGEKSQRAKVECHYRWHRLLEQQTGVKKCAIASQADDEIDTILKIMCLI